MKYVIIDNLFAIIFNEAIPHDKVGRDKNVTSAGFCSLHTDDENNIGVQVWGKSVSLGVESKTDDDEIIKRTIEFRC